MDLTLLYFDDCPHWKVADARLAALAAERSDLTLTRRLVPDVAEADRIGFLGSPSILVDGVDPFAEPGSQVGLSCRRYRHPTDTRARRRSNNFVTRSPVRERLATVGPLAAVAGALGLCCGLRCCCRWACSVHSPASPCRAGR